MKTKQRPVIICLLTCIGWATFIALFQLALRIAAGGAK